MSDNSFIGASNVVGTYLFGGAGLLAAAETGTGIQILYIDPVDFEVAGKTLKYRIRAMLLTNAKAPACTFTVGLYPITGTAGISGKVKPTIGAVVAGSTVAFVSQAASTQGKGLSTEFTPPAAGYYAIGVEQSVATSALESNEIISGYLQEHVI
jgi:hypothetical protein